MATRRGMLRLLDQHRRNLEALELQKAQMGATAPVAVDLQIEDERDAIAKLEADLHALSANSQRYLKGDDGRSDVDAEAQAIMDAQMSRMFQQMDRIDARTEQTRDQMVEMRHEMQIMASRVAHLEAQLTALQHGPQNVNRTWLLSGAVLLAAMFILVVLLALRLV